MERNTIFLTLGILAAAALVGCGGEETASGHGPEKPSKPFDPMSLSLEDPKLIQGREVWMLTCANCHATGLGEAPIIANKEAWSKRIAKGKETLYDHAINGFSGPLMLEMPPKGGYDHLSDEEVMRAVDFMVHASQ